MESPEERKSFLKSSGLVDAANHLRPTVVNVAGDGVEDTFCEDDVRLPFRWNDVFTAYMLSISITALHFAGSHDSTYTPQIMSMGFIHFAFETTQSWYFIYSGKLAHYLSALTITLCLAEAVLVWIFFDSMRLIFRIQFVASDCFSFLSAVCLLFNKAIPERIRLMACSVMLHFIGISIKLYYLPTELYVADAYSMRHHGAGWILLVVTSLPQIWLCRDVIRGGINHIGRVRYDRNMNSKAFIVFSKCWVPFIGLLLLPSIAVLLTYYGTVEKSEESRTKFANWIWDDVIMVTMWPIGMAGVMWILYLRATPLKAR